jgi:hypothetical protein
MQRPALAFKQPPAFDTARLPFRTFDLQPVPAFAGGVAAVAALADDALQTEAPAVFHQQVRVIELLDQEQAGHDGLAFRQRVELPLARDERFIGEVGAVPRSTCRRSARRYRSS